MAQERAEKEKFELEKKKERELQLKKEMERIREQVIVQVKELKFKIGHEVSVQSVYELVQG